MAEWPLRGLLRSALVNWAGLGRPNELGRAAAKKKKKPRPKVRAGRFGPASWAFWGLQSGRVKMSFFD